MTTRIFFDNQSNYDFELIDVDKYSYGIIKSCSRFYTFILPYYGVSPSNSNPLRPFYLVAKGNKNINITMNLNSVGQIANLYQISPDAVGANLNCLVNGTMNVNYPYSTPLTNIVNNLGTNKSVIPTPTILPQPIYNTFVIYTGIIPLDNNPINNPNSCPACPVIASYIN
jgi:hypothetical protein